MADLQTCRKTTSKIRSEVENCIGKVSASRGDSDVRSSTNNLTGAGLSDDTLKAAGAVSKAHTTLANRLTNHHSGIYNATNQLKATGDAVTTYTPKGGHN